MPNNQVAEKTFTRSQVAAFMLYSASILRRYGEPEAAHYFCEVGDHFAADGNLPPMHSSTFAEEVEAILGVTE